MDCPKYITVSAFSQLADYLELADVRLWVEGGERGILVIGVG